MEHFEIIINSFTDEDALMNFAATWGIQDTPEVRFRLFQLRNCEYGNNFVNDELDTILEQFDGPINSNGDFEIALEYIQMQEEIEQCIKAFLFDDEMEELAQRCIQDDEWNQTNSTEYIQTQEEIDQCIKALLFDDEMEELAQICIQDGEWNPITPAMQIGGGEEPQAGPSLRPDHKRGLQYTIRKKSERTHAKNAAIDRTYKVKVDDEYRGQKLQDVREGLHQLFDDVLEEVRGDLAGNDLGRVVIHHNELHNPIVVPLQPWERLNVDIVLGAIEKVLNSKKDLSVNESFEVSIGSIELPKGSGGLRRRITRIKGKNNSLQLKKSIVTIENTDKLCMARAIAVSWAKLKRCSGEEWSEITKNRGKKSNLELVLENRKVPESYYKDLTKKNKKQQKQFAVAISQLAGVPLDRPASLQDLEAFEEVLGVRVMVVSAKLGNKFITSPSEVDHPCIYVYLVDDEHFHSITSITGFFSVSYFCKKCLKQYNNLGSHQCEICCIVCKRGRCLKTDRPVKCKVCNMECRSENCYKSHKEKPVHKNGEDKGTTRGPSPCEKFWKCPTCYKVVNKEKRKIEDHQCGEHFCKSCKSFVLEDHLCYLRAISAKEDFKSKFIFFDFECTQDEKLECKMGYVDSRRPYCKNCQPEKMCNTCTKCRHCSTSWCGRTTHVPNYLIAHTVCEKCIDKPLSQNSICKQCGTRCEQCEFFNDEEDTGPCPGKCGFREVIFEGEDTRDKFGEWLFSYHHKYAKAVAHNMKGYDGYFILEYLIDHAIRPDKIIYSGSKIMYMTVERGLHIKIIDSLNFLPMKLGSLPKAFGLQELKKGWFPHFFNTKENQQYVGPYPEKKYYGVDFMSSGEREEFLKWYQTKTDQRFDFRKEMLEYCRSDVDILRQACLNFRYLLMSSTGTQEEITNDKGKLEKVWVGAVDPFDFVTIASVCMNVYRTKWLEERWKVMLSGDKVWSSGKLIDGKMHVFYQDEWTPEGELNGKKIMKKEFVSTPIAKIPPGGYRDQCSKISIQWLEWMSHKNHVSIQHAFNLGEKSLPGTKYKLDGYCLETNTAYEFHGCAFHGCPDCYSDDREGTFHPITDQSMNELYTLTMKKKSYIENLGMKYTCIWEHEFREQIHLNQEMKTFIDNLEITDRLDPRESFFGGRTNASRLYYQTQNEEKIKYVDFTSLYPWVNKYCEYPVGHPEIIVKNFKDINQYFGIAKVKILAPRGLYHPVLPYRSNNKLKFPLCRHCADIENEDPCKCSDEDRVLIGTWCTPEIQKAVCLGYKIVKLYEVYHWQITEKYDPISREGGLFAKYIDTFLKFKQEASGPPNWIKNATDVSTYIDQYFEKEGVSLDQENIKKNPGLRALAKLCLNSFWGKFGQRLNMKQTRFFHDTEVNEFFKMLSDPMKKPQNFHIISDEILQMEWIHKQDCQPEDNKTNIYLATFTTCWARLKLYSVLEALDRRVLYYDTDSVIYVSREGQYEPPLGDYLGDLTDELENEEHIVEFLGAGPKNYSYKTNKGREISKIRGITLNFKNSQLIHFDSIKNMVTDPKHCKDIVVTNPNKICRDKRKRKLINKEEKKSYQIVYTKRKRIDNYDTVPFGY